MGQRDADRLSDSHGYPSCATRQWSVFGITLHILHLGLLARVCQCPLETMRVCQWRVGQPVKPKQPSHWHDHRAALISALSGTVIDRKSHDTVSVPRTVAF